MRHWQERTLWAVALCAALGLWTTGGAQTGSGLGPTGPSFPVPPGAGTDTFDSIAEVQVVGQPGGQGTIEPLTIDLVGPTTVQRSAPRRGARGTFTIDTEILAMDLQGYHPDLGTVQIRESPTRASLGRISGKAPEPFVQSFFDVFVEVTLERMLPPVHNDEAAHLEAMIRAIPPIETAYNGTGQPVDLRDAQGTVVARLVHVQHVPCEPSHRKIKREVILLERKLDLLLQQHGIPPPN